MGLAIFLVLIKKHAIFVQCLDGEMLTLFVKPGGCGDNILDVKHKLVNKKAVAYYRLLTYEGDEPRDDVYFTTVTDRPVKGAIPVGATLQLNYNLDRNRLIR